MAVDTVDIVAARAEAAWRHASHRLQNQFLMFAELVVMIVMAVGVGAFAKQIIHVTELQFLHADEIFLGNTMVQSINPLAIFIALHHSREVWTGRPRRLLEIDIAGIRSGYRRPRCIAGAGRRRVRRRPLQGDRSDRCVSGLLRGWFNWPRSELGITEQLRKLGHTIGIR